MDTSHWSQEIGIVLVKPLPPSMDEIMMVPSSSSPSTSSTIRIPAIPQLMERATPTGLLHKEHLQCPRCNSTNTKFCYFNNYSLTQPRYFCKTCRRYWTEGGSLRNVPVGGGSRKKRRSASTTNTATVTNISSKNPSSVTQAMNPIFHQGKLNFSLYGNNNIDGSVLHPKINDGEFGLQSLLSSTNSNVNNSLHMVTDHIQQEEGRRRVVFPFEGLAHVSTYFDQNEGQGTTDHGSSGFWNNGVIGKRRSTSDDEQQQQQRYYSRP